MTADEEDGLFVPPSEVLEVPIASDPSTLLEADLSAAEASLLQQDELEIDTNFAIAEQLPDGEVPLLSPPRPRKARLDSLRIEGPLTPQMSSPTASRIEINLPDLSKGLRVNQSPEALEHQGQKDTDATFSDGFLTALEGNSKHLMRDIQQERLKASDAEARVPIPVMDFCLPEPRWQEVPLDALSQWSLIRQALGTLNAPVWPRDSKKERKEFCWSIFPPKLGYVSLDESVEDEEVLTTLLGVPNPGEIPTSADYVWKQPGLAILRDQAEIEWEELEPITEIIEQEKPNDLDALVKKRRRNAQEDPASSSPVDMVDLVQFPESPKEETSETATNAQNQKTSLLVGDNDGSAAATLLSNFVDFHTTKRRKQTKSSFFPVAESNKKGAEPVAATDPVSENQTKRSMPPDQLQLKHATLAPCPHVIPLAGPITIIKSLSLGRNIFSRLTRLCPSAEIIERDFDRWNTVAWENHSVSRSPIVSPLAAEADIIVSPATGIILTTLLRAIQKPPPGHKGDAAIRERLSNVALRYERLIVLVSEGNRIDETTRDLTPSECAAYADFVGFVAALPTNGQTYYVGGGDDTLTKWLISFVARYSSEAAAVREYLIEDESLWELFLRRAGMNAYAAQGVLALLKSDDKTPEEEAVSRFGLPAFVRMSAEERMHTFRGLLGGENVLTRVSNLLDTRWD
ncbi:hypothetical protein DL766_005211 [Monosporascus sp. MC13-8B]|uniref:Uncharacterized protein n=1 Tax=Monosporascus cannonballus TaxID=155416 RepID=A0ABY0GTU2_9PEZI|nr:hypothetical protein DL763_011265 [Monosporascus cannonballus]RYO77150.1 hypothetical protein DL762_009448 [Monosporascus cannonballus]RYP29785.1 hypothetical protein DL766_005211 [Monosporascus sp. MC13-8B]